MDFGFLNFTTLEARLEYCREEVRLNSRLAPDVYIDVVPIFYVDGRAKIGELGEPGEAVEYAVKMRRLDEGRILSEMISSGKAGTEEIERVARVVAAFHEMAETGPRISEFGSVKVISGNVAENFSQTESFVGRTIPKERFDEIKSYSEGFLEENATLFGKRQDGGYIRDCHGDIHSEHIAMEDSIEIFDCIEFNERFRYSDVVSDAAFLSMDLEFRSRGDLSGAFERAYFKSTGDTEGERLMDFYKCYRAYVRGKVEGFRLDEAEETDIDKRRARAHAAVYFHLAHLYATCGATPVMLVIRGLPATGKSTLSCEISALTGMARISSDGVRKELFKVPATEHRHAGYEEGIYTKEATEMTYATLVERGVKMLEKRRSAILDATFAKREYIERAQSAALEKGALFYVIECACDDEVVRDRMRSRTKKPREGSDVTSDATWEVYLKKKEGFEDIANKRLILDTSAKPEVVAAEAVWKVFGVL